MLRWPIQRSPGRPSTCSTRDYRRRAAAFHGWRGQSDMSSISGSLVWYIVCTVACIRSTGRHSSWTSYPDHWHDISAYTCQRSGTGCSPTARYVNASMGALILFFKERLSSCRICNSPRGKRRYKASANFLSTEAFHSVRRFNPLWSRNFFNRRSSRIIGRLVDTNEFVICSTVWLSTLTRMLSCHSLST